MMDFQLIFQLGDQGVGDSQALSLHTLKINIHKLIDQYVYMRV